MFNNLPGVQISTLDGGLAVNASPTTKSLLIIGTSSRGPADTPYQVTDRDTAAQLFGTEGTLARALEEASTYCDNVYLFRLGTTAGQLSGVGADTGNTTGITVALGERSADVYGDDPDGRLGYDVWYLNGVLYVWLDGTLVYSNDAALGNVLDTGNVLVTGLATAGLSIAKKVAVTGTVATLGTAVTGTGTAFTTELAVGDYLEAATGEVQTVKTITSATAVVLNTAFASNLVAGAAIKVIKANTAKTPDGALNIAAAAALTTIGAKTKPVLARGNVGLSLTLRQLYVAQAEALKLLETFPVNGVFAPGCYLDAPNVAYYNSLDSTTAVNNPASNADALDWLNSVTDSYGVTTYHWASELTDSTGKAVSAATFLNRQDRLDQSYTEVDFGYQLARFAQFQEEELGGCVAFIGTSGPVGYDLPNIRKWIGFLPTYDTITGNVEVSGRGLLGIPLLVGCASAQLNPLAADYLIGRTPGFYKTDTGELDGNVEADKNSYPIDLGAYLHVIGDYALNASGVGSYVGNIAGFVAGMVQAMDEKSSPTNKPLRMVRQLYRASLTQLDSLTQANINMLRFKRVGDPPYLLHGMTAANDQSDWTNLLRMRIKFLVVQKLFDQGDRFVGESSSDGLQLQAMQTALDAQLQDLQKRGYIQRYRFSVHTTQADQRIGRAYIDVNFMPADELVQLRATVSISRQ